MVEGEADILPEEDLLTAIELGHEINVEIVSLIDELVEKAGKEERAWDVHVSPDRALEAMGESWYQRFVEAHHTEGKHARSQAISALKDEARDTFVNDDEEDGITSAEVSKAFDKFEDRAMREDIVKTGKRADGRALDEVRDLSSEVALLPRAHGSAVFTRGETQALATTTLGTVADELRVLDPLVETPNKKFLLHYNFPPFSVGEVRPARGPGRREIGHGNLAERAIEPVLPNKEDFPYTIRVVSEILESNGSSSQATICAGTLALMDAGVPIYDPVAGIAMGLVKTDDDVYILSDIAGAEDHHGDMDLKVAGTQHGITALQMDLKVDGISAETMEKAFEQAREARLHILRHMLTTLSEPREEISSFAPRLVHVKIDPDYIGKLIGPGGKNIKALEEKYGVTIEVEDDGTVTVSSPEKAGAQECAEYIGYMGREVEVGATYEGTVVEIKDFGAIVELFPGSDGLCHISQLSDDYVKNVTDVCQVGDRMKVKVLKVEGNSVRLSRKEALAEEEG
jgi:polyribonucleotide nucleotidyltransferase